MVEAEGAKEREDLRLRSFETRRWTTREGRGVGRQLSSLPMQQEKLDRGEHHVHRRLSRLCASRHGEELGVVRDSFAEGFVEPGVELRRFGAGEVAEERGQPFG